MAPGVNGGGRVTGTVPKTKSHNESSREYGGTPRRDYSHFNHMSNNLTSLDWQPVSDSVRHPRSRKESNTSVSRFSEPYDTEDNAVSQDNLWYASPQRSTHYMNHSDDDEASQASWAENGQRKSNNLATMPEKAQVATRLHQIRDYISQTTTMMENLRAAGGQGETGQLDINYGGSLTSNARDGHRNQSGGSGQKATAAEIARRNELKQKFEESQRKLMELQEQRETLLALRQKAQEQLKEARAAQSSLLAAAGVNGTQQGAPPGVDKNIQSRIHALQRFYDERNQVVQMLGCDDPEILDLQRKLDELQAKKQHMDQLVTQFATLNGHQQDLIETSEHDVRDKMAELVAIREQLAQLTMLTQVNGLQDNVDKDTRNPPQDKQDNRISTLEKYETTECHLQAKSLKLQEAKAKLKLLQSLLATVEELRQSGQPVPENIIQLLNSASSLDDRSSTPPSQQDRSDVSLYEYSPPVATEKERERVVNSSERDKSQHQRTGSSSGKHTNQQAKVKSNSQQLEELIRKDLMSAVNQDLQAQQGFSYQDAPGTAAASGAAWRDSTQDTSDERDNEQTPEYSTDERDEDAAANGHFLGSVANNNSSISKEAGLPSNRETANLTVDSLSISGINNTSSSHTSLSQAPHNVWRKQSSGSTASLPRGMWTPASAQQQPQQQHARQENICRVDELATTQPDNNWIVQQITQLQTQLQQMSGLYKTFFEKQHNCVPPPWLPPPNIAASVGPYCQYIATASQWQQQQLLVHSLNQCCQLIWHQQRELSALKEALNAIQQPRPPLQVEETRFSPSNQSHGSVDQPSQLTTDHSNLSRLPHPRQHQALKSSHSAGLYQPNLAPPTTVSSAHSLPNLSSPQASGQHTITERNTNVVSPAPANCLNIAQENRNILTSSPTATVLSLPPNLNINSNLNSAQNHNVYFNPSSHFNDPNFVNYYPPYGNNLNFDGFPSPVNFLPPPQNHHDSFLSWPPTNNPQPAPTLNNQVPPGNRANNYWDNFRSYSRQNLLSGSSKSNEGLPQSPNLERSQNLSERTSLSHPPELPAFNMSRKEKVNLQSQHIIENISYHPPEAMSISTRAQVHHEPSNQKTEQDTADESQFNDEASGYQAQNLVRHQSYMPRGNQPVYQHNLIGGQCQANRRQVQSGGVKSRNYSTTQSENTEPLPKLNRKAQHRSGSNSYSNVYDTLSAENRRVNRHNQVEMAKGAKISQMNNYQAVSEDYTENDMTFAPNTCPVNTECVPPSVRGKKYSHNEDVQRNCAEGKCPLASDKSVRKKEYKGNSSKEPSVRTESNKLQDSIEECVYSEVAALISVNEKRPQFLLQLFKDLRQLNSDSERQAALSTIHSLANRIVQHEDPIETVSEESASNMPSGETTTDNSPPQPRNVSAWMQKDMTMSQLPISCAKLDWEVRSILLEMLPFIKSRLSETCTSLLLEALRKLILHLVPSQPPHEHLDGLLEDALLKFHGCRLRDVCDELVTVVAEVLISELTFLRLVNTVHHNPETNGEELNEEEGEDDEEEGAVGGVVESQHHEAMANHGVMLHPHPANQIGRRSKSETVSEADLAEADQSRHSDHNGDDDIVVEHLEDATEETRDEASGNSRDTDMTDNTEDNKTEALQAANWAVEEDHEMGLDEVPTRLINLTDNNEPDSFNQPTSNSHSNINPAPPSDPGPI